MPNIIESDDTRCAGCLVCMLRCSYRFEKAFKLSASRIMVKRLINQPVEFEITFAEACDACGLCAKYCPYEALTLKRLKKVEK